MRLEEERPLLRRTFKLLAFLGRYAHQDIGTLMRRSVVDLTILAEETGKLIEEEAAAAKRETDG